MKYVSHVLTCVWGKYVKYLRDREHVLKGDFNFNTPVYWKSLCYNQIIRAQKPETWKSTVVLKQLQL